MPNKCLCSHSQIRKIIIYKINYHLVKSFIVIVKKDSNFSVNTTDNPLLAAICVITVKNLAFLMYRTLKNPLNIIKAILMLYKEW